jgi:hypothetical protein
MAAKIGTDERRVSRRGVIAGMGGAALTPWSALARGQPAPFAVSPELQRRMYETALGIARRKVRGGEPGSVYPERFVDAAFSSHIFLWDTCFIAAYAKYHQDELPIAAALDNFYERQDADGFICREYDEAGRPFWPKDHPVSINPPLMAFAELELFSQRPHRVRLARVYPKLAANFEFIKRTWRGDDGLYIGDALGSGMDNIERYPFGWTDDGKGIALHNLYPQVFDYKGLSAAWNRQGRSVDLSAQMALFADNLAGIAGRLGKPGEAVRWRTEHGRIAAAINGRCWDETDGWYYDLGYGKPIRRRHIGAFWTLIAGVAGPARVERMVRRLTDPSQFWRETPVPALPADMAGFQSDGGYWRGGVWAPTNYMLIRGLARCGRRDLARRLALAWYGRVAQVFEATGTFWENYAPDAVAPGKPSRGDFCGWTAIAPIAIWREFVGGPASSVHLDSGPTAVIETRPSPAMRSRAISFA